MEEQKNNKLESINGLLVEQGSTPQDVLIPVGDEERVLRVWVKELSFIEMQSAVKDLMNVDNEGKIEIDLGGYWRFVMMNCIDRTEPELSKAQLLALKPEVASRIIAILPGPEELMSSPLV